MANSASDTSGGFVRRLVERTIQRNINGVSYFVTPDPAVGLTTKSTVHKRGTLTLFHYEAQTDEIYRVPILIVTPTTNKSYCLDMMPGVSFVDFLVKSGYDVFMIDWAPPGPEEKSLSLADYCDGFIHECLRVIKRTTGQDEATLIGYCMGGVLSSIFCALNPDAGVKNLVCFTTPVDFSEMGMFNKVTDQKHFDVDQLVDAVGVIPPSFVLQGFSLVDPAAKATSRVRLWKDMWDADFVENFRKYDRWTNDMLPLAGEYFRQTVKDLLWGNRLLKRTLKIDGRLADISQINIPVFHAVAEHDNLVKSGASGPLIEMVRSKDKTELVLKGGHVSLVCGPNAVGRLWPVLDEWLSERSY